MNNKKPVGFDLARRTLDKRQYNNRLSIKSHPQSRKKGFVQCRHFTEKAVLHMRESALFYAKASNFSKFVVYPHGQWD